MTEPRVIQISGCSTKYSLINGIYEKVPAYHHGLPCYAKQEGTPEEALCYVFHSGNARWVVSKRLDDGTRCYAFLNDDADCPSGDVTTCKGFWVTCVDDSNQWVQDERIICRVADQSVISTNSRVDTIGVSSAEQIKLVSTQSDQCEKVTEAPSLLNLVSEKTQPDLVSEKTLHQPELVAEKTKGSASSANPVSLSQSHKSLHQHCRERLQKNHQKIHDKRDLGRYLSRSHIDSSSRSKQTKAKRRSCLDWVLGTKIGYFSTFIFSAVLIILSGTISWKLLGGTEDYDESWDESLWIAWGFFFDPGAHMSIPTTELGRTRMVAIFFSLLGFIFNLVFLGVVVDAIRQFLDTYKQDRDRLFIEDHTLILGWCDKTLFLLDEILHEQETEVLETRFCKRRHRRKVVVMAEREQVEMMQDIRHHFTKPEERARIRCVLARKGCAYDLDDLLRASIGTARKVIVLASEGLPRECDLEVVRICVALASLPQGDEVSGRVIAEVRCVEVAPVLKKLLPNVDGIHARSSANLVFCLCAAVPYVAQAFVKLCSFATDEELYVYDVPQQCDGVTFGEVCKFFTSAVVIAIIPSSNKDVEFAPSDNKCVSAKDRLILLARDVSQVRNDAKLSKTGSNGAWSNGALKSRKVDAVHPAEDRKTVPVLSASCSILPLKLPAEDGRLFVILGWPNDFVDLAREIDAFAPPGSTIEVLATKSLKIREAAIPEALDNGTTIKHIMGDRRNEHHLRTLVNLDKAFSILIVAESMGETRTENGICLDFGEEDTAGDDAITSDSACLMCLLMVDSILDDEIMSLERSKEKAQRQSADVVHRPHVVCEVLDPRTDRLLQRNEDLDRKAIFFRSNLLETGMFMMAATDDGPVIFNALTSLMSKLSGVDLLGIPLISVTQPGNYSFWELHDIVRKYGAILVGWVLDKDKSYECKLCPAKDQRQDCNGSEVLLMIRESGNAPQTLR